MAPGCTIHYTGVRPGEKLHETLLSADEARHTILSEDLYVIKPEFPWWGTKNWTDGIQLPEGFSFESDSNENWLDDTAFLELIGESSDVSRLSTARR